MSRANRRRRYRNRRAWLRLPYFQRMFVRPDGRTLEEVYGPPRLFRDGTGTYALLPVFASFPAPVTISELLVRGEVEPGALPYRAERLPNAGSARAATLAIAAMGRRVGR